MAGMRQARFRDPSGSVRFGEWTDNGIRAAGRRYDVDSVDVLAPVEPTKVLGVGRNYRGYHDSPADIPDRPFIWSKGGPHVVAGHQDTVTIPDSGDVVYEAELGVIIGEQCRHVSQDAAMEVVAGFTCVDDISDMARRDEESLFRAKSFDNAAPMGPVVASPARVPDTPQIQLWINGDQRQDTAGDEFVFSVPEVIAAFTDRVTLEPGDVIMMGNPGGFAPLEHGDTVTIEVEGVGRLEHDVEIAGASAAGSG